MWDKRLTLHDHHAHLLIHLPQHDHAFLNRWINRAKLGTPFEALYETDSCIVLYLRASTQQRSVAKIYLYTFDD